MDIRQAKKLDLQKILKFYGKQDANRHMPRKKFILSYITNKQNFFFIALNENKIVGTVNGEVWIDKCFAYIGEISAKGKDKSEIICKMYAYFVHFCKKNRITLVNSYVRKNKKQQINVFKKLGLKKKGNYLYFEKNI
jgi:hypothetical protein